MLKKYITYTDYNGQTRKEAFYFNLSKSELVKMEMVTDGGMESFLQRIIDTKDNKKLFELFEQMIKMSYGVKSEDGRRFIKKPELSEAFMQTEAYTELLLELMGENSTEAVLEFIKGIMPLDGIDTNVVDAEFKKAISDVEANSVVDLTTK